MCDTNLRERASLLEWCITVATATVLAVIIIHRALSCGLFGDELLFVHAIELGLQNSLMAPGSSHPPLVRLIVSLIADPSQSPDWLLRLPSLVFATGCVFVWQRVLERVIERRLLRCLLLPAIALNPLWLGQAFQCLPYPALVFFGSLHCLAWMRFVERPSLHRTAALVLSGSVLPWIHFYGVNVLITGQLIWLLLLWNRQFDLREYVYTNLCTAALTLPVIPLAVFYVVNDRPYPLIEIKDYGSYFVLFSSYCFSKVTFPGLELSQPFFMLVYLGIGIYIWKHHLCRGNRVDRLDNARLVAIGFLLAGFTAAQVHSVVSHAAMWPRYMLIGSWIHLPVIVMLLLVFELRHVAWTFSVGCAALAVSQFAYQASFTTGTDYGAVARHIESSRLPNDAFLVQSMDMWQGENHFDRLWLERYAVSRLPTVTGALQSRSGLIGRGLPLTSIKRDVDRVWVYSHLFRRTWLSKQNIHGWRLAELRDFGGPFPLALLERASRASADTTVALRGSFGN